MKCDQRATHTGFIAGRQFWFCAEHTFSDFQTIQGNSGIQCQRVEIVDLEEDAAKIEAEWNRLKAERRVSSRMVRS